MIIMYCSNPSPDGHCPQVDSRQKDRGEREERRNNEIYTENLTHVGLKVRAADAGVAVHCGLESLSLVPQLNKPHVRHSQLSHGAQSGEAGREGLRQPQQRLRRLHAGLSRETAPVNYSRSQKSFQKRSLFTRLLLHDSSVDI